MKKIIPLLAAIMLTTTVQVQAAQRAITGLTGLGAAINTLVNSSDFASNDTIVLTRGATYVLGGTANTIHTKGVAIMADPNTTGELPVIDCANYDAFSFNGPADLPDAYFRLENIKFIGTGRDDGKYFITTANTNGVTITYGGIEAKGCIFELKSRAFLRGRVLLTMSSILFEDCIFQNCEDLSGSSADAYGIITPQFGGTNQITSIRFRNTTVYNTTNSIISCTISLTTNLEVENCSFLYSGGCNKTSSLFHFTNLQAGSTVVFRNNIIKGYYTGTAITPTQAINIAPATIPVSFLYTYFTGVGKLTNLTSGQYTEQPLSKASENILIDFEGLTETPISYVITGDDASYMRSAGFGGACVGDPRSYPDYTPPVPLDFTWAGADNALWDIPANWSPNGLPSESGTATIASGIAQSSGGRMNSTVILKSGGTLILASAPDTITTLVLEGGTLQGDNTLQGEVTLNSKSTISVPASGTLTLPAGISGSDTLVKADNGTLYLTAASNAFAGTWRVEAGAVKVDEAGTALGTEVKVDLCGGKLELSGVVVSLSGFFFQDGTDLPIGTYTAASHPDLVAGAGSLRITDSHIFTYVNQSRASWESKFNWFPVRDLTNGDTAVVEGSYDAGGGATKAYDVELSPATFPSGAKLILRDAARARLTISAAPTAARSAFTADIEMAKGVIYTATTSKNLFGLDGELTILDTAYFQPDARVESDTVTSGNMDNKISPISIGATLHGSKPIVLSVSQQNLDSHGGTYGLQLVKANNLDFTGDWLVEKTSLVGKAAACFGRSNAIYLSSGTSLYLDVADATDKTQTISAAQGSKIYLNGDTRLTTLVLGDQTYTEGEFTAASHPDYISGEGAIKLGMVPVASITISTPDDVQAAVVSATLQLSAAAYPLNADDRDVTWSVTSGDATIDAATGLLTLGATAGSVTVTAKTLNGTTATKTIEALAAPQLITELSIAGPASMEMGEEVTYTASYQPANATDVQLVWEITAGEADTVRLSNSTLQVVSKSTNPLELKVSAQAAPSVSTTKQTTILRATRYTWVANDALTAGGDGKWEEAQYWTPQVLPQVGDSAYVNENTRETKFALGTGGDDKEHAKFAAKLFLMPEAKLRVAITNDATADLDPFTSAWDAVDNSFCAEAPFYLLGGTIGVYSNSAKIWGVAGEINVLAPSYLLLEAPSNMAALYVFAEVKGSSQLILTGRESTMSNNPNETTAGLTYSESTIILRRANPDFTGTWKLDLLNLYTKEEQGFGKGNFVVGTGRKLIVDHEKAVDSTATITIASGGKISTRLSSSITIAVGSLVLNGEAQEPGYYSRNTPATAAYFDNDRVIIKVGNLELVPVENITISGPSKVAVGADAQLTPLVTPSNAEQRVEWSVEPAGMATISESGLLTSGSAAGCVTVKATATDESGVFGTKEIAIGDATCGSATAAEAEDLATLTVSPNPVQSALNIADEKVIGEVRIYTLTSTLIKAATLNAKEATIDVSSLPAGAYLVVVYYANTDKKAAKLIVKN